MKAADVWERAFQRIFASILAVTAGALQGNAADFVTANPPPETPEVTAVEIEACLAETGAYKMPKATLPVAIEDCSARARGLTAQEFVALIGGCVFVQDDAARASCSTATEKLGPQFVPSGVPSAAGITATELASLELGCTAVVHVIDHRRCLSATAKIRLLLLHPELRRARKAIGSTR